MMKAELCPTLKAIVLQTHWHAINIQGHLPSTVKALNKVSEGEDEGGCKSDKERVKYKKWRIRIAISASETFTVSLWVNTTG